MALVEHLNPEVTQYLPTPEEQDWLIEAFADLVSKRGHHHLVSMPIVEPTAHFFPDRLEL